MAMGRDRRLQGVGLEPTWPLPAAGARARALPKSSETAYFAGIVPCRSRQQVFCLERICKGLKGVRPIKPLLRSNRSRQSATLSIYLHYSCLLLNTSRACDRSVSAWNAWNEWRFRHSGIVEMGAKPFHAVSHCPERHGTSRVCDNGRRYQANVSGRKDGG